MKRLLIGLIALGSVSSFAAETKYNCSVGHFIGADTKNYVENIIVRLDKPASKAVLPLTKRRVTLGLSTYQIDPTAIDLYGQYQLEVRITDNKEVVGVDDKSISASGIFIGLDKAIQLITSSEEGQSSYLVSIQCNKI